MQTGKPLARGAITILVVGIVAALGVGKLPPVLLVIGEEFGMSLVASSLLVSLFQIAGAIGGLFAGTLADRFGHRLLMQIGLMILTLGSLGGAASGSAEWLLASRMLESFGFITAVLPGPALLRTAVPVGRLRGWLGLWGTYMPTGIMLGLLITPWLTEALNWRAVWVGHALLLASVWLAVRLHLPTPAARTDEPSRAGPMVRTPFWPMLIRTLRASGPWLLAASFAAYAGQYLSIIAFLPTIYQQAGIALGSAGALTAFVAGANVIGNIGAGLAIQRGFNPGITLGIAALALILGSWAAFASGFGFSVRYGVILLTSAVCGLIPGSLFALVPRYAPDPVAVSGTVGLMQQGAAAGQVVLPLLVAWAASMSGGWQNTWIVISAFALVNLMLGVVIGRRQQKRPD